MNCPVVDRLTADLLEISADDGTLRQNKVYNSFRAISLLG
jgi:hypothetical protein